VICSSIRGVDVTASTPAPAGVVDDGSGLPETGAPANTSGLLLAALGLLVTGGLLVRPRRRLALHRA
jgi:LPXTG-motif cell wall-anchored protein